MIITAKIISTMFKKIIIVFNSLDIGGIERKIVDLSRYYSTQNNIEIDILLKRYQGQLIKYVPNSVKIHYPQHSQFFPFWLIKMLFFLKPNLILSFGNYCAVLSIIAKYITFSKYNIIISEDSSITTQIETDKFPIIRKLFVKICYPYATSIITLTETGKNKLINLVPKTKNIITILPNWLPLTIKKTNINYKKNIDILFLGRLVPQKNPLLFLKFCKKLQNLNITMIGSGILEPTIRNYIKKYKLNIKLLPATINPSIYYQKSKILLITSTHEGFPLTILESFANNCLPIIPNLSEIIDFFDYQPKNIIYTHNPINKIKFLLNNPKIMSQINKKYYNKVTSQQSSNFTSTTNFLKQYI